MNLARLIAEQRVQFKALGPLLRLTRGKAAYAPYVVLLGLGASLAEGVAVSLVVVFLYSALGQSEAVAGSGALLSEAIAFLDRFGGGILAAGLALFAVVLAKVLLTLAYTVLTAWVGNDLSRQVRDTLHFQYLTMSYGEILQRDHGELVTILATESFSVSEACLSLAQIGINLCAILVFGVFLFSLSWEITLAAGLGAAAVMALLQVFSRPAKALGAQMSFIYDTLANQMVHSLQGMRTLRAFGQEPVRQRNFEASSRDAYEVALRVERLAAFMRPVAELSSLALLGLIGVIAMALRIPLPVTLAAIVLLYRLQPHLRNIERNLLHLAQLESPLGRVSRMLDQSDKRYAPTGSVEFTGLQDAIRFEDVAFTHVGAAKRSLDGASFSIRKGGVTALVGPSGSGKTTIVNLLVRLYEPDAGRIAVDGVDLTTLTRASWLSRLAVAGQDVDLIESTILENIRMARADATLEDIRDAADQAGILDVIDTLPEGLDTWVGEGGARLSGGQRQRIGLARALVSRPDILVLDEALNAIEGGLEDEIRNRLVESFRGRAVVLITHRMETALTADHVVCLDQGRVVDEGSPDTLRHRDGGAFNRLLQRRRLV